MKRVRNRILVFLNKLFGEASFIHYLGWQIYQLQFFAMKFYFQKKFPAISNIHSRHSLNHPQDFNLFFSDIDTTFIVRHENAFPEIIRHFKKFKSLFPMFDMPEFYTETEGDVLESITSEAFAPFLNVVWNLRKLNWIKTAVCKDQYEKLKLERAFKKSFPIVFKCSPRKNDVYFLSEINQFNKMLSIFYSNEICLFSPYLNTTTKNSLRIIGNNDDFIKFNSLMAGETQVYFDDELSKIKYAIEVRELLIVNTSIRVDEVAGKDLTELQNWKAFLDSRKAMDHFQKSISSNR